MGVRRYLLEIILPLTKLMVEYFPFRNLLAFSAESSTISRSKATNIIKTIVQCFRSYLNLGQHSLVQ